MVSFKNYYRGICHFLIDKKMIFYINLHLKKEGYNIIYEKLLKNKEKNGYMM